MNWELLNYVLFTFEYLNAIKTIIHYSKGFKFVAKVFASI